MKNICFISPSLHQGGLENSVMVMANEMAKRGNKVSVVCIYNNPVFYKLDKQIELILPTYNRKDYTTITYYVKSIKHIRKSIKKINPDVIVSYGDFLNPLSIIATLRLNIPVFISDRSSPGKKFPFIVQKMRKLLYPRAMGIIAQTETAKKQKLEMLTGYTNIEVIPNPLRPIVEYPEIKQENIILGVGRHYPVKGLDRLIEAFAQLKANDWKLVIAGNQGPHTKELYNLVEKFGIVDKVEFLGAVKEIDKVFAQAKIFVLPSRSEGFPNALIEAMANGLASISYNINAGPSDIINDGFNGFLVQEGDIIKLSDKIEFLMNNEAERLRIAKEAIKIKDDLSVEKIGNQFYNFIITQKCKQ